MGRIKNLDEIKGQADCLAIIQNFRKLTRQGQWYAGKVREERTASFKVHPGRNTWFDFGSGEGGDAIAYLMQFEGMDFREAVSYVAQESGIQIEEDNRQLTAQEQEVKGKREQLARALSFAYHYYWPTVEKLEASPETLEYLKTLNLDEKILTKYSVCIGPSSSKGLKALGMKSEIEKELKELGILKEKDAYTYDAFINRIIYPIFNRHGRLVGLSGRKVGDRKGPKYVNTATDSAGLFIKGQHLWGLNKNGSSIRRKEEAILVEGYTDVMAMDQIGQGRGVGKMAGVLTDDQAKLLKRYCSKVLLIPDHDHKVNPETGEVTSPGLAAAAKDIETLARHDIASRICIPPQGMDPFDMVRLFSAWTADPTADITRVISKTSQNAIVWAVKQQLPNREAETLLKARKYAVNLISGLSEDRQGLYLEILKQKDLLAWPVSVLRRALGDIKKAKKEAEDKKKEAQEAPQFTESQQADRREFQIYEKKGRYYNFNDYPITNFKVTPLFLLPGDNESIRVLEIENTEGEKLIIAADATQFVKMGKFQELVETKGYFRLTSSKAEDYEKLKNLIMKRSKTAYSIRYPGQQRLGFWAWSNGIITADGFKQVNKTGIVTHEGSRYYFPAFAPSGNVNPLEDDNPFEVLKSFSHKVAPVSFREWAKLYLEVHGRDKGIVSMLFYVASLYRDFIFSLENTFPLMFLFGKPGSGKTFLAKSIVAMFGSHKTINLNTISKAALARYLAMYRNAILGLEEFRNDLDGEKYQFCKGIYDGTGRDKASGEKKFLTTKDDINSTAVLNGQEIPTADIALAERCVILAFSKSMRTPEERERGTRLKDLEKEGLTGITTDLVRHRHLVVNKYRECYEDVRRQLKGLLADEAGTKDRFIENFAVLLSVYLCLYEKVKFPFDLGEALDISVRLIKEQTVRMKETDEFSIYCTVLQYLVGEGDVKQGTHFIIESKTKETINWGGTKGEKSSKGWDTPRRLLYVRTREIHGKYMNALRKLYGRQGYSKPELETFLVGHSSYLGHKTRKFEGTNATTCLVFDLELMPINLVLSSGGPGKAKGNKEDDQGEFPY